MSDKTDVYNLGTCEYCGQDQTVDTCNTQEEADQLATLHCDCPEAATAAKAVNKEQERKDTREKTLAAACEDIEDLFGGGGKRAGRGIAGRGNLRRVAPVGRMGV